MASSSQPLRPIRARRATKGPLPVSERQLDAYLLTRDTLRRVQALASIAPAPRRAQPPATPSASPKP